MKWAEERKGDVQSTGQARTTDQPHIPDPKRVPSALMSQNGGTATTCSTVWSCYHCRASIASWSDTLGHEVQWAQHAVHGVIGYAPHAACGSLYNPRAALKMIQFSGLDLPWI